VRFGEAQSTNVNEPGNGSDDITSEQSTAEINLNEASVENAIAEEMFNIQESFEQQTGVNSAATQEESEETVHSNRPDRVSFNENIAYEDVDLPTAEIVPQEQSQEDSTIGTDDFISS